MDGGTILLIILISLFALLGYFEWKKDRKVIEEEEEEISHPDIVIQTQIDKSDDSTWYFVMKDGVAVKATRSKDKALEIYNNLVNDPYKIAKDIKGGKYGSD